MMYYTIKFSNDSFDAGCAPRMNKTFFETCTVSSLTFILCEANWVLQNGRVIKSGKIDCLRPIKGVPDLFQGHFLILQNA